MASSAQASSADELVELAARLARIDYAALGAVGQSVARQRVFDTLGALAIGLATPEGLLLGDHAQRSRHGARAWSVGQRCRLYVGATRSTEIDDIDLESCTTVGAVVVPVALILGAAHALRARALLAAVGAGYEAMIRLGRAIGGATLLYRGVWPTYVTAAFGAAATAARVLGLDEAATARALALAASRCAPVPAAALAKHGARYWALGGAAADGIDAALAAAAGVDADLGALEGYAERLGAPLARARLTDRLGAPWLVGAVDTKPWPTARQALASVAAFKLHGVGADSDVERIVVHVPAAYRAMVDRPVPPSTRIESMIGVQYQLALAALAPERLYDVQRTALPGGSELTELMTKVEVRSDDELDRRFPATWGSRVSVRFASGAEASREVLDPDGSSRRPPSWDELERKLERVHASSGYVPADRLRDLRAACERLGATDDSIDELDSFAAHACDIASASGSSSHERKP